MNPTTHLLVVDYNFPRSNQCVVGLGPLEFVDPSVFNNAEDEFTRFEFRSFISGEVEDAGLVKRFLPRSYR